MHSQIQHTVRYRLTRHHLWTLAVYGLLLFALAALPPAAPCQTPLGIAWDVRGLWHDGASSHPIRTGDALAAGDLLQPDPSASDHSLTVLLPDGQRVLYECFTAQDCARGFRVPSLYLKPDTFAADMLARIRAVLTQSKSDLSGKSDSDLPEDEVVAVLTPGGQVNIAGLAASLQHDRYTCRVHSLTRPAARQPAQTVEKTSRSLTLKLPGPGLYEVAVSDSLQRPRIHILLAAITPSQAVAIQKPFDQAHALFMDWNEDYQGWPVHRFQRAFLRSLMLGIKPPADTHSAPTEKVQPEVTAEPHFSPRPGVFKADTAVALHSDTPGAVIHFTVDGSQPFPTSPVYEAPIMVKRTELTIKAFATAAGKKDSPVVTGIFRIGK